MITNYFLWSVTCPVYPWALLLHMTIQQCGLGSVAAQTNGSSESGREEELGQSETEEENHFCPQVWQSHSCRRIPHGRKWAEQWSGVGWGGGGGTQKLLAPTLICPLHLLPPPLWNTSVFFSLPHICIRILRSPCLQFLSLFPAALMFFRSSHFSTPAMLWQTYCSGFFFFLAHLFWL